MRCCGRRHRRPGLLVGVADTVGVSSANAVGAVNDAAASPAGLFEDINWKVDLGLTVQDQGSCGSCWIMCSVGLMESMMKIANPGGATQAFSVQYVHDHCDPSAAPSDSILLRMHTKFLLSIGCTVACLGGSPGACLDFLVRTGVPRATEYREYVGRNRFLWEIRRDKVTFGEPELFHLRDVAMLGPGIGGEVSETYRIRYATWLSCKGPGVSTVKCIDWGRNSLDENHTYIGRYGKKHVHCLLVVGFRWKERLWIVLNSHGRGYGDDGVFQIPFDADSGLGELFWVGNV